MEADDSAINVPAVAAGRVIKRYQAQAPDEITLEVGDLLSVIDMPSTDETIWWRGKKGFDVSCCRLSYTSSFSWFRGFFWNHGFSGSH